MGAEASRQEFSTAAALPDDLRAWLNCWRLARTAH